MTILHGEGGYSRNSEQVLLSVVSNRQLPKLEKIAHLIDPTCFMIVSHVTEVSGAASRWKRITRRRTDFARRYLQNTGQLGYSIEER